MGPEDSRTLPPSEVAREKRRAAKPLAEKLRTLDKVLERQELELSVEYDLRSENDLMMVLINLRGFREVVKMMTEKVEGDGKETTP